MRIHAPWESIPPGSFYCNHFDHIKLSIAQIKRKLIFLYVTTSNSLIIPRNCRLRQQVTFALLRL